MKAILSSSLSKIGNLERASKASLHNSSLRLENTKFTDTQQQMHAANMAEIDEVPNYNEWPHERLIQRVTQLEKELKDKVQSNKQKVVKIQPSWGAGGTIDPSKYSTRLIALKIAYLGKNYNGFEHHANNRTPLPTIEEELWKALDKCKLIFPRTADTSPPGEVNWEGCEYSKCGRTDKGVSAFGQVIGIRVRSNRPLTKFKLNGSLKKNGITLPSELQDTNSLQSDSELVSPVVSSSEKVEGELGGSCLDDGAEDALSFDPIKDEIPYPVLLNRLLPPDIRILAWCPALPPDFSARFSCRERQYKYFFTQPAFPPTPQHLKTSTNKGAVGKTIRDGWLDIEAMREAAKNFIGVHDFRNFCKVDGSKQITNFERRIFHADIVEEDSTLGFVNNTSFMPERSTVRCASTQPPRFPKVYSFTLHGSAFLWHQVRHMVAILFLVGQGLELPSIISKLLDVRENPSRPMYEMASDVPLVLWNCIFPHEDDMERKDSLKWLYVGDEPGRGDTKYGSHGLVENIWKLWRERKIDEVLAGTLIDVVASQGKSVQTLTSAPTKDAKSQRVFDGRNSYKLQGTYVPVMKKPLLEPPETINEKYAIRKGWWETTQDQRDQGFRRLNKPMVPEDCEE